MKRLLAVLLLPLPLLLPRLHAASIETRDGRHLDGAVNMTARAITVTHGGRPATLSWAEVARVSFLEAVKSTTLTNTPWTSTDVGDDLKQPGTTRWTNGALALTASGWGLWRDADGLRLASVPLAEDGELVAQVGGFEDGSGTVLGGISLRENFSPQARHISLLCSSKGVLTFRARGDDGFVQRKLAEEHDRPWLRLARSGSRLAAYVSGDGTNWSPVEGVSISTGRAMQAGLVAATEINAFSGTAFFREATLRTGTPANEPNDLPAPALVLRDGSILTGSITATNDRVELGRNGAARSFNLHGVAALLLRPVPAHVALQPAISPTTGVMMNDRDWLDGEVRELTPKGVVLASVLFGDKTIPWSDHPAAIVLGGRTMKADWEIWLRDGSRLAGREFSFEQGAGLIRTAVGDFPLAVSELAAIRALK